LAALPHSTSRKAPLRSRGSGKAAYSRNQGSQGRRQKPAGLAPVKKEKSVADTPLTEYLENFWKPDANMPTSKRMLKKSRFHYSTSKTTTKTYAAMLSRFRASAV
jgi:hypothetical protein